MGLDEHTKHTEQPALVRRQLGRHLRRLRIAAGKTHGDAEIAGMGHRSTMWRVEAGRGNVRPSTGRALCWLYGADAATSDALYAMALQAEQPGWWEDFRSDLPGWFTLYVQEDPVHLDLVLCESVLQRAIGGPAVLAAQREHLRQLNQRANIDVRVLAFTTGAHPAIDDPGDPGRV